MKKIFFILLFFMGTLTAGAQADSLQLKEYTGKYLFPEGSPVSEIGVMVDRGLLTATSVMGNSELRKTDTKDVFEVVAYAGTATFKRGDDGKIKAMRIQVQDVDMEGTKDSGSAVARFGYYSWRRDAW